MALQVIFAAEHASATAVAGALGGPTGTPLGFLQICTADGIAPLGETDDDGPAHDRGDESCVICGTAAVAGAIEALAPIATIAAFIPSDVPPSRTVKDAAFARPALRSGTTRGPPRA